MNKHRQPEPFPDAPPMGFWRGLAFLWYISVMGTLASIGIIMLVPVIEFLIFGE